MDNFYSGRGLKVYKPTGDDLEQIVNSASRAEDGGQTTKIGHVRYATATPADAAAVNIAAEDFVAQRTALFGMTRTGKSNTVKIIARAVFEMRRPEDGTRVGQIIFDPTANTQTPTPRTRAAYATWATTSGQIPTTW